MKKKKSTFPTATDIYDKFNACSSTECTGLITVPPENDAELESYMDVYDFGPPVTKAENKDKDRK